MAPDNLLKESNDSFRATGSSDIVQILQDIERGHKLVTLTLLGGLKILTVILEVDGKSGHFVYDTGRTREETHAVLATEMVQFSADLRGVSVRFTTPAPVETEFKGGRAFRSPFPLNLLYVQRREHFRTTFIRPYVCTARLVDGTAVKLNMKDISVGGVKLESTRVSPESLPVGTLLRDAEMDFLGLGKVEVSLLIASQQTVIEQGRPTYLYGCRFEHMSMDKEATVQRLVFSLEQSNRPRSSSTTRRF